MPCQCRPCSTISSPYYARHIPVCQWQAGSNAKEAVIHIKATNAALQEIILWQANSNDMHFSQQKWEGSKLTKEEAASQTVLYLTLPMASGRFMLILYILIPMGAPIQRTRAYFYWIRKKYYCNNYIINFRT